MTDAYRVCVIAHDALTDLDRERDCMNEVDPSLSKSTTDSNE